jgi:hypothetical protein
MEKLTSILWLQSELKAKIPDDWKITFNPLWLPTEAEQATTELTKQQAHTQEVTNLMTLMTSQILAPEEVRQVIVQDVFPEYEFSPDLPDLPDELQYSANVDTTQMDVPPDKPGQAPPRGRQPPPRTR